MMNFRSKKSIDFVAASKNFEESVNQTKRIHDSWFRRYGWLLNEYEQILKAGKKLCEERKGELNIQEPEKDKRTCLPYPETTTGQYGWLAAKPDFKLERYGPYIFKYPIEETVLIPGDFPTIAAGKGFI